MRVLEGHGFKTHRTTIFLKVLFNYLTFRSSRICDEQGDALNPSPGVICDEFGYKKVVRHALTIMRDKNENSVTYYG